MTEFDIFIKKAQEKMNECKALMETQPMTEQLASDIEETAATLLREYRSLKENEDFDYLATEPVSFCENVLLPWYKKVFSVWAKFIEEKYARCI